VKSSSQRREIYLENQGCLMLGFQYIYLICLYAVFFVLKKVYIFITGLTMKYFK